MGEKVTTMTVQCFLTNAQKKVLNEFMRLHNYHASTRFKKDFVRTTSGTDYEKEQKFKADNPTIVINYMFDDTKIVIRPMVTIFKSIVWYKPVITVTKKGKTYKSKITLIKNILNK